MCQTSPASTLRSTRGFPPERRCTRFRATSRSGTESAGTDSTGCRSPTRRAAPLRCSEGPWRTCGWWCATLPAAMPAASWASGGSAARVLRGGVGAGSGSVRTLGCEGLGSLGGGVQAASLEEPPADDVDLTAEGATVRTLVIHAGEDLQVAA